MDFAVPVLMTGSPKKPRAKALGLFSEVFSMLGRRVIPAGATCVAQGLGTLLLPAWLLFFASHVTSSSAHPTQGILEQIIGLGLAVFLALFLSQIGEVWVREWLHNRIDGDLRRKVMRRLYQCPIDRVDGQKRSEWLGRITNDLVEVERFFCESIPMQLRSLAVLLGGVTVLVVEGGLGALCACAMLPLLLLARWGLSARALRASRELAVLRERSLQSLVDSLQGTRSIRSVQGEPYLHRHLENQLAELEVAGRKLARRVGFLTGGARSLVAPALLTAFVAGIWLVGRGQITAPKLLAYPFFFVLLVDSAFGLVDGVSDWRHFFTHGSRVAELVSADAEDLSGPPPARVDGYRQPSSDISSFNRLAVKKLVVGRAGGDVVSPPIDFEVKRRQIWAVVGSAKSGKSALLETLAGLRPALEGSAVVYGESGPCWESHRAPQFPIGLCALVESRPYLFEGTFRDNLVFGNPLRPSDALIWQVLEDTSLYQKARLRGGLDSPIGPGGRGLSRGERYLVAVARALLLQRPFLFLDEPFAALPRTSLATLVETLNREKLRGLGIVMVSDYLPARLEVDSLLDFDELGVGETSAWDVEIPIEHLPEVRGLEA